jgi:hypothetical protein
MECWQPRPRFFLYKNGAGTVHVAVRSSNVELFRYKSTDLFDFSFPQHGDVAGTELLEFASIVHMLAAHPDLIDKGICIAVYNSGGIAVSMVPLGTMH